MSFQQGKEVSHIAEKQNFQRLTVMVGSHALIQEDRAIELQPMIKEHGNIFVMVLCTRVNGGNREGKSDIDAHRVLWVMT